MRVDAHQHYWRFDPVRDAWITPEMPALRRDFLPNDVAPLIRASRIDAVVAVQADQSIAETELLLALAAQYKFVRGVVGWIDLGAPDINDQLARYHAAPALKGFRHIAQGESDDFLTQPHVIRGINALGAADYSYDILVYPRQLPAAITLVRSCPSVSFVLDHCAKPPIATGDLASWRADFAQLAQLPNVSCKLSGLVTEAVWDRWTAAELTPVLDAALDAFGPERLMFGSDWPVCLLAAEYARVVGVVEGWAAALSTSEQAAILGETAQRVYRLVASDDSPSTHPHV